MDYLEANAVISACGHYRYTLTRLWNPDRGTLVFCMLNPSTADGTQDDPTIRRCVGFADAWGYGRLVVVNLFAYRATNPDAMLAAAAPVGPDNDDHITRECAGREVVLAWGSAFTRVPTRDTGASRAEVITRRPTAVGRIIQRAGGVMTCLGLTADGQPRHPLYVRRDAKRILVAIPEQNTETR